MKAMNSKSIIITAVNRPSEVAIENYRKQLSYAIKQLIQNKAG